MYPHPTDPYAEGAAIRRLRHSQRGIVLKGLLFAVPAISALMASTWPGSPHAPSHCGSASAEQAVVMLRTAKPSAGDLRAIALAAAAQRDLDIRAEQQLAHLPGEIGGRSPAEVTLVESYDQIRRVRDVYAWMATSRELTRALLVLADVNQRRAEALYELRRGEPGTPVSPCLNQDIGLLWRTIHDWSGSVAITSGVASDAPAAPPRA